MDNLNPHIRRKNMQNIRSKNTIMELKVRSLLHKKGLRFRIHTNLIGKPDIVFQSKRVVVFLDSCFFHKCPYHYIETKSNKKYWKPKLQRNKERAKEVNEHLKKDGWTVLRFWEHQIKKNPEKVISKIITNLN